MDISLFLVVMLGVLLAFGILFNLVYIVTPMDSFDDLGTTMFSLFRGLLGDVSSPLPFPP